MSKQKTVAYKAPTTSNKALKNQITAMFFQILPIILIAAFVPLIVQLKVVSVPDDIGAFWSSDNIHMDFFSKSKSTYLIILSSLSVLVLIGSKLTKLGASVGVISLENKTFLQKLFYKENTLRMERVVALPLIIYTAFTILSTFLSEYKSVAFSGFPDRAEGLWVLLAYIAIWVTIIMLVKDIRQVNWVVAAMFFSGFLMCLVGITQALGNDILQSDFGKALIVPENYSKIRENLSFNMAPNSAYSTLYNTNNVGSMMSMLSIFGAAITILSKKIYVKAVAAVFTAINIFTLLASNSRGGYLGAFAGTVFLAILLLTVYKLKPKYILIAGIVLITPIIIVFFAKDRFTNLSRLTIDNMLSGEVLPISERQTEPVATAILGFSTKGNTVEIMTNAGNIHIEYEGRDNIELRDDDNNIIPHTKEEDIVRSSHEKFSSMAITVGNDDVRVILNMELLFAYHENEMWFVGPNGFLVKAEEQSDIYPEFFKKYGRMGSSRGAIWGSTIPLLKDTFLIGRGPDNFAMYYPQNDYTSKMMYLGTPMIIVDKPHNQYLQMAVNQGVVALIGFLTALLAYYFWSIRNIIKRRDAKNIYTTYNVALGAGMMAYLVAGLFNDSIVSVAPIFWTMWGLGCAVNMMISASPIEE